MVKHAYREEVNRNVGIQCVDLDIHLEKECFNGWQCGIAYLYIFFYFLCTLSHRNISEQLKFRPFIFLQIKLQNIAIHLP